MDGSSVSREHLEDEQRRIGTSVYGEWLPLYVGKDRKEQAEKAKLASGPETVTQLFSRAQ